MGYIAKLTKGATFIDLSSGRYTLDDFIPPTTTVAPRVGTTGVKFSETLPPRSWSFTVRVLGLSSAEVKTGVDDIINFLRGAGDEVQPLYFEWRPDNNVSADPVWGQFGATRRVEIVDGTAEYWDGYNSGPNTKDRVAFITLELTIKPAAHGHRQLLAQAKGGIVEDWIGTKDGRSRGVMVPEADATNGNRFTNPIFGHATWNNGWTAGANITAAKNTLPEFVLFGLRSAQLSSAGVVLNTFTQSLAAGNTNTHILSCYAKLLDSGVISSGECSLYYGSSQTTTYTAVGNGWYRLSASVAGVVAATATGLVVSNSKTVYVTGFQLEERAYITPFFYGDMLGCRWSGTAHDSKSLRDTAYLRLPTADLINASGGTIRICWKADRANTTYAADAFLLFLTNLEIFFEDAADKWVFELSGSSAGTTEYADTFVSNDIIVIHITWSHNGCFLYLNGANAGGSSLGYTYFAPGAYLYLGSNDTPAAHIGGKFLDFSIFQRAATSAEVLADYTNIAQIIADDQQVGSVPYLWTKDGDSVVDYIDSGAYENIAIIGGVPGDLPAKVEFKATVAGMSNADVYIGNLGVEYRKFIDPEFLSYVPASPPDTISLGSVSGAPLATVSLDDDEFEIVSGKKVALMLRVDDDTSGNNVLIKTGINPGGGYYYSKLLSTIFATTTTEVSIDLTPEVYVVPNEELYRELGITRAASVRAVGRRSSGGALDFKLHSAQIFPFPMIRLVNTSASGISPTILYLDGKAYEVNSSALSYTYSITGARKSFSLYPGIYNLLVSYIGREAIATDSGDTLTYNAFYVTPRWMIL